MTKTFKILIGVLFALSNIQAQDFAPKKFKEIDGYKDFILDAEFSANNKYLAVTVKDNSIELRNKYFEKIWGYQNNPKNYGMKATFSPNEKYLAFSKYQSWRDAAILDIENKQIIQKLKTGYAPAIRYSPDGKFLITAGRSRERNSGIIKVWQWKGKKFEKVQSFTYTDKRLQYFQAIKFSPDGKFFAIDGIMGNLLIYKRSKGQFKEFQQVPQRRWMRTLAFHPSGKHLVFNTKSLFFSLDLKGRGKHQKFVYADSIKVYGGDTWDMEFDPKGKHLVVAKSQNSIKIYEWENGKFSREEEDTNESHRGSVLAMDMNKELMVSGGADKKVNIYTFGKIPITKTNVHPKTTDIKKGDVTKKDDIIGDDLDIDVGAAGKNYLLVVGINKYKFWNPLGNATTDAKKVKKVLQKRYGFTETNTFEIYNEKATNKNILKKLSELREKIGPQDNLLLYYSGHGFYNAAIKEGFWIPFNAKKGEETEYLANSTLLKYIKAIKARHIFLVADACFSGSLFTQGKRGYIDNVERYRSRWGFASGRLEFVSDGGVGESSPFATYFLKFLTDNKKKRFPASELIQFVKIAVSNNANQTPIGHPLKNVGDEGGEFVFYLKGK